MVTEAVKVERIELPYAPDLPGLTFRHFLGKSDYQNILDMINASKQADQVDRTDSLEDIARYYENLNNCDPYQDMIFAEVDGQTIAYGRSEWVVDEEDRWLGFHIAFSHPDWRRKGIGTAMLRYMEKHLRDKSLELLDEGVINEYMPLYLEAFTSDTEIDKERLLNQAGYEPVRFAYSMVRPFSEPINITPMPDGLEIRTVKPEQFRQVWEADQEAFKDHWGYVEGTEVDYQRWLKDPLNDPELWRVAWDGDEVAGMVLNLLNEEENKEYNRQRGWTENISVRKPWRRQGLARALLTRSMQMFKDMGMDHAALGVDTQNTNGALNLYESVGFVVEKRHTTYWKDL
ncbi:MAG: GNAT family N-acetyltransferase [Chloroflexota bacterium]|nr:MAG: GNAT family N-acetyltransferase [Chloroflexota bacterium]